MERRQFLTGLAAVGGLLWSPDAPAAAGELRSFPKRPLGRTGVEVTVLGLGGFTGMKEVRSEKFDPLELASAAFEAGIRYFDTAPAYNDGQSERNYGEALERRRGEIFLATKTGERTYDGALRSVEASLKRLRTDRVDLFQVHATRADEDIEAWGKPGGVLKAFEKLRDEKVVRWIGVTGHESAEAMCRAIALYDFDTVLTTFNPTPKRAAFLQKVLPAATGKKMGIIAMKVMGGAFGSLASGNPVKNDGAPHHDDAPRQAGAADLIRYVLGLPVTAAIVGMSSLEQLRINAAAARDSAPLDDGERKALEARMAAPENRDKG